MGEEIFRILVVDDNRTSLDIIEKMMTKCKYQVTTTTRATDALSMLKQKNNIFDLVVSEVHMPDMDGFNLLEQIKLETDIPVIVMSFEYDKNDVLESINRGACDYLIKPIPLETVKTMWQHVVRKQMNQMKEMEKSGVRKGEHRAPFPTVASFGSVFEATWGSSNKNKDDDEVELEEKDVSSPGKRRRVVWSAELHQKFVSVVKQLGIEKAVPKKVLQLMNVPGITRENVASHLQKYRLYCRRDNGGSTSQNQVGNYAKPLHSSHSQKTSPADALAIQEMTLNQVLLPGVPPMQSLGVASCNNASPPLSQEGPFKSSTYFSSNTGYGRDNINPMNTNTFHGLPSNATIDPMQLAYLELQQVQNARNMPSQPYILSSYGTAIFNNNVTALYNNLVPTQFPQPSPVYNHAMATQLPLTANGLLLNATTLLPGMLQDEGCSDAEALQSPTPGNISKGGV